MTAAFRHFASRRLGAALSWTVAGWVVVIALVVAHRLLELPAALPRAAFPPAAPPRAGTAAVDQEQLACLALNIYFEARSEPTAGQVAVGHVVINRARDPGFPNTLCEVVRQGGAQPRDGCQFSWWCDARSDRPDEGHAWRTSLRLADEILRGWHADPTGGALWYHANYVAPYWRGSFDKGPEIGQHVFYHRKTATDVWQSFGFIETMAP